MHDNFLKFHIENVNVIGFNISLIARTTVYNQYFYIRIRLNKYANLCVSKHNLLQRYIFVGAF